jgi:hypothetical protein
MTNPYLHRLVAIFLLSYATLLTAPASAQSTQGSGGQQQSEPAAQGTQQSDNDNGYVPENGSERLKLQQDLQTKTLEIQQDVTQARSGTQDRNFNSNNPYIRG